MSRPLWKTPSKGKRRKYLNKPVGGFDSGKEARVHAALTLQRKASDPDQRVTDIQIHVPFNLLPAQRAPNGKLLERGVSYIADFVVTYASGRVVVVDVKNPLTRKLPAYVLKRKLMLFIHGIAIVEW